MEVIIRTGSPLGFRRKKRGERWRGGGFEVSLLNTCPTVDEVFACKLAHCRRLEEFGDGEASYFIEPDLEVAEVLHGSLNANAIWVFLGIIFRSC